MAKSKTQPTELSASAFLDSIDDKAKRDDAKTLAKIMQGATGEKPKMWGPSIVGFGSYHYVYDSGREGDAPILAFSPRKPAMVLYIHAANDEIHPLLSKLGTHTTGKGCVYIKKLSDVDQKVLSELIGKSYSVMSAKHKL